MKQIFFLAVFAFSFIIYVHTDSCVQCNSSTDPKCATNPGQYLAKECTNTTSKCYTRVLNGHTIRGCASDLDNVTAARCNNEMECLICSFMEGCNRNVFPTHRTQCLQCSGNGTNSSCALNIHEQAAVCPIYKLGDKCFIRNNGRNVTGAFQRGCLSSLQEQHLCLNESNCFTCEGVGCNYLRANDEQIPLARDDAAIVVQSLFLLLFTAFILAKLN